MRNASISHLISPVFLCALVLLPDRLAAFLGCLQPSRVAPPHSTPVSPSRTTSPRKLKIQARRYCMKIAQKKKNLCRTGDQLIGSFDLPPALSMPCCISFLAIFS